MRVRTLAYWDYGFESHQGYECLSLVSVVCCQVEVPTMDRSLLQRNPTECGVSECDIEISRMRKHRLTRAVKQWKKDKNQIHA